MEQAVERLGREILSHPKFRQLQELPHHGSRNTVYDHSVAVAEQAYGMARWLRLEEAETASVVRAALLHDFFGYDWHGERYHRGLRHYSGFQRLIRMHAFIHGPLAAKRARRVFGLNEIECEAIRCHMFPLSALPRTRIAWIVTAADKIVAARELAAVVECRFLRFSQHAFA